MLHDRPWTLVFQRDVCSCRISTDKCVAQSLCHSRASCEFWLAGSHCQRNHPFQMFCQSVQAFWSSDPRKFCYHHKIGRSNGLSYNSVSNAVLHCDIMLLSSFLLSERSWFCLFLCTLRSD